MDIKVAINIGLLILFVFLLLITYDFFKRKQFESNKKKSAYLNLQNYYKNNPIKQNSTNPLLSLLGIVKYL